MRKRQLLVNILLVLTILCVYRGTLTEDFKGHKDFLQSSAHPFRGWKEVDHALSKDEETLLKPDAVLIRSYENDGQFLELAVIAGHKKQTVHTPSYCMVGGGWERVSIADANLQVGTLKIPAVHTIMVKGNQELMVTYFFTNGELFTCDLVRFQGMQMLHRLQGKSSLGALVRIAVPVTKGRGVARALINEFASTNLASLIEAIKVAQSGRRSV